MRASDARCFAGLDIGGTSVKSILVDASGNLLGDMVEVASRVKDGYEATFAQLEEALLLLTDRAGRNQSDIAGIGLDVPAPSSSGVIRVQANLGADWVGTNIRDEFSACVGVPVYMTNDGNAAAAGEYAVRDRLRRGSFAYCAWNGFGRRIGFAWWADLRGIKWSRAGSGACFGSVSGGGWGVARLFVWAYGVCGGLGVAYGIATQARG